MLISIVIPAFNEERIIRQTLQHIKAAVNANQSHGFSWEIVVCDNNSSDQTGTLARESGAVVFFEPVNQIARARNTGAAGAKGEWLLFIDADTYPSSELIAEVLGVIQGGIYIGCGATIQVKGGTLFNKLRMERLNPLFRLLNFCGGAFLLCERKAFESISGFSTYLYAYEEIDFVFRLKGFGKKQGKKFKVIHNYPAFTSGRKGEYGVMPLLKLFSSNVAAVVLFVLHYFLPKKWIERLGTRLFAYWYEVRK